MALPLSEDMPPAVTAHSHVPSLLLSAATKMSAKPAEVSVVDPTVAAPSKVPVTYKRPAELS